MSSRTAIGREDERIDLGARATGEKRKPQAYADWPSSQYFAVRTHRMDGDVLRYRYSATLRGIRARRRIAVARRMPGSADGLRVGR